jgi:hypothetical protein
MDRFSDFAALAASETPARVFTVLQALVQSEVGAVIFSCSTFDLAAGNSRRIHTNMPDVYPVSGLKEITPNAWTRIVLDGRKSFVANTLAEIRTVFPDHELIGSLGCGSVINMPVFLAGRFMGTVNVLHEPGYYTPKRVAGLQGLQPAAMLAFGCHAVG